MLKDLRETLELAEKMAMLLNIASQHVVQADLREQFREAVLMTQLRCREIRENNRKNDAASYVPLKDLF